MAEHGPIVVGFDGSPCSVQAVNWAVTEAVFRSGPLVLCHVGQSRQALGDGEDAAAGRLSGRSPAVRVMRGRGHRTWTWFQGFCSAIRRASLSMPHPVQRCSSSAGVGTTAFVSCGWVR
jgi:hypothetical protein